MALAAWVSVLLLFERPASSTATPDAPSGSSKPEALSVSGCFGWWVLSVLPPASFAVKPLALAAGDTRDAPRACARSGKSADGTKGGHFLSAMSEARGVDGKPEAQSVCDLTPPLMSACEHLCP